MTFKLAHLSDPHIGYSSGKHMDKQRINLRARDGYQALSEACDQMIAEQVDAVLWPGDIFHVPEPKIRDIIFMQNQLRRLADAGIPSYLLAGNHDARDIATEIAASRVVDDPYRKIYSEHNPYVTHEIADGIVIHMLSHHLFSAQSETMKKVKPVDGAINILAAHGSVIDPLTKLKLHTEQSPREVIIPDFLLNDFDWNYTLLGHIHERGWVGSKNSSQEPKSGLKVFYNGSLIRRGFSDKETALGRGWTLWLIEADGSMTAKPFTVKQRYQQDLPLIDALNLSGSDITELILKNLSSTPGFGEKFSEKDAPLLRQEVSNLTPAKYHSLDWKTISLNYEHAFQWSLKQTNAMNTMAEVTAYGDVAPQETIDSGDVVKLYDDWTDKSNALSRVPTEHKSQVVEQGRKFIHSGQEGVLDES